jgi:hypothetical protein
VEKMYFPRTLGESAGAGKYLLKIPIFFVNIMTPMDNSYWKGKASWTRRKDSGRPGKRLFGM